MAVCTLLKLISERLNSRPYRLTLVTEITVDLVLKTYVLQVCHSSRQFLFSRTWPSSGRVLVISKTADATFKVITIGSSVEVPVPSTVAEVRATYTLTTGLSHPTIDNTSMRTAVSVVGTTAMTGVALLHHNGLVFQEHHFPLPKITTRTNGRE